MVDSPGHHMNSTLLLSYSIKTTMVCDYGLSYSLSMRYLFTGLAQLEDSFLQELSRSQDPKTVRIFISHQQFCYFH
jgi:hypothetical protein